MDVGPHGSRPRQRVIGTVELFRVTRFPALNSSVVSRDAGFELRRSGFAEPTIAIPIVSAAMTILRWVAAL